MTVSPVRPPSTTTQSPTAGNAAGSSPASNRRRPLTAARCSPAVPRTWYEPRSSATTRAGWRPSSACGACAEASVSVQPSATSAATSLISAHPLQLAGPLRVALGPAECPQAERDQERAHHEERPDIAEKRRDGRAVDQALPDPVEDVGRGRDMRQHLHPAGKDVDRVVHAAHE